MTMSVAVEIELMMPALTPVVTNRANSPPDVLCRDATGNGFQVIGAASIDAPQPELGLAGT